MFYPTGFTVFSLITPEVMQVLGQKSCLLLPATLLKTDLFRRYFLTNYLANRYRYGLKFYNWLPVFLEKEQTTSTNQNFIIRCRYFSCCYLFVSLWYFSHMFLPYLSSDGLIFFCFSLCGALGLLFCLKSKKYKGSDSLPNLMGNCHKPYLYISAIMFGWMARSLDQRVH